MGNLNMAGSAFALTALLFFSGALWMIGCTDAIADWMGMGN